MATRTWIGGSHNWSATAAWVEGIVPTAADDVLVGTGVGGSTTGTPTIDGTSGSPSLCRSLNCTSFTGSINFASGKQINIGDGSGGSLTCPAGFSFTGGTPFGAFHFVSTTTGNTITFGAHTAMIDFTFDGVGGGWTFQDDTPNIGGTINLVNGTLNTNGKTLGGSLNGGWLLSSSNSNTRALTLGASNWHLGLATGTVWDITNSTGMTLSAGSSTLIADNANNTQTFNGGGLTYGTLTGSFTSSANLTITGANTFGTLTMNMKAAGNPGVNAAWILAANQTVTGTLNIQGLNNSTERTFVCSDTLGTQRTLTCNGTLSATNADFRDINGAGSASWNLSAITGGSGDCGGNSGITFNTPKNCYMKTAVSVNWSGSNWFTASGGSTPISPSIPLPQDTAIFDVNSVTAGGKTITMDAGVIHLPAMDWTGVANTPAFVTNVGPIEIYGSLKLASGMTHTGVDNWIFKGRGSYTIDGGTLTWPASSTITISGTSSDTYSLNAALTSSGSLTVASGTFALNTYTGTFSTASLTGGTTSGKTTSTLATTTTFSMSGGTMNLAHLTVGTTFTQSGGAITVPPLGTITWGTGSSWTWTPNTFTFTTQGVPTWTGASLTVAQAGSFSYGG